MQMLVLLSPAGCHFLTNIMSNLKRSTSCGKKLVVINCITEQIVLIKLNWSFTMFTVSLNNRVMKISMHHGPPWNAVLVGQRCIKVSTTRLFKETAYIVNDQLSFSSALRYESMYHETNALWRPDGDRVCA